MPILNTSKKHSDRWAMESYRTDLLLISKVNKDLSEKIDKKHCI